MLVYTTFSLFKMNEGKISCLFMQMQCASSLTDGILLFYNGINCQGDDETILL